MEQHKDPLLRGHNTTFATEEDTQCGYSSPRGVCLLIALPGAAYCSVHLCPHEGCGNKKGSRDADCGQAHEELYRDIAPNADDGASLNPFASAAAPAAAVSPHAQKLGLSATDVVRYEALWAEAETANGMLAAGSAVKFLGTSGLPQGDLGQIWTLADYLDPRGALSKDEFYIACKLVALRQAGGEIRFDGIGSPTALPRLGANPSPAPAPAASLNPFATGAPAAEAPNPFGGGGGGGGGAGPAAAGAGAMTLVQKADAIKRELGLDMSMAIPMVVKEASMLLGLDPSQYKDLPSKIAAILALVLPSAGLDAPAPTPAPAPATSNTNAFTEANEEAGGMYNVVDPLAQTPEERLAAERANHKIAWMYKIRDSRGMWFQHHLTRQTAEATLCQKMQAGAFVVRKSSRDGFYSISVATMRQPPVWHGLVRYHPNGSFDMQGTAVFATLDDLVYFLTTELVPGNSALPPVLITL